MTSLTIEMEVDYPKLYRFGYSATNDIETVTNWQVGNNRFINVANGRKYLFALNLRDAFAPTIKADILVSCNCSLLIHSITKTLHTDCELRIILLTKTLRVLEMDWSSGQTTEESNDPESEWSSDETTACNLKINSITKTLH